MSDLDKPSEHDDVAPGDVASDPRARALRAFVSYCLGLLLAAGMTAASFWAVDTPLIYGPGIPVTLVALAVAQMGIHLVFFLHMTTAPDNANNVLALAFGVLICCLVIFGSLWIMTHLNHAMMPMHRMMEMQ